MEGMEDGDARPRQVRDPTADGAARPWLARRFEGRTALRVHFHIAAPQEFIRPVSRVRPVSTSNLGVHHHLSAVPDRRRERPA
jgi:hypothetical protein